MDFIFKHSVVEVVFVTTKYITAEPNIHNQWFFFKGDKHLKMEWYSAAYNIKLLRKYPSLNTNVLEYQHQWCHHQLFDPESS